MVINSLTVHLKLSHYFFENVIIAKHLWICCGYAAYVKSWPYFLVGKDILDEPISQCLI